MAGIGVLPITAEGGDLNGMALWGHQGNGAVGCPHFHQALPSKDSTGLLWPGAGGHVPVEGALSQKGVPNAAPHTPGLKAGGR